MTPEQEMKKLAEDHDTVVRWHVGKHPFVVWQVPDGYALSGVFEGTIIRLLPRPTASAVYDRFSDIIDTRGQ